MAGAACAKAIIDQGNAVQQVMSCLTATLLLRAPSAYPTEEQEAEFLAAAAKFSGVAAAIQAAVADGAFDPGRKHGGHEGPPGREPA